MITITDEELEAIVADVKRTLDNGLAAQAATLTKSDTDDSPGQEDSPADAKSDADSAPQDSPAASAPASADSAPADASASPAPASPDAASAAPAAAGAAIEPAPTAEGLASEYATLSPEEFQMHFQAMQMAATQMGMDLGSMMAGPAASAAPAMPASPAAASPAASPAPAMSPAASPAPASPAPAMAASPAPAASPDPLAALKSEKEAELAELKKNQGALEAQFVELTNAMKKYFSAPLAKAVTTASEVAFIAKPGDAPEVKPEVQKTPAEVLASLRKAARDPDLKKKDRDLIDAYVEKKATYEQIKHLLG